MTSGNPSNANSKRGSDSIYGAVEKRPKPLASDENYRVPTENWKGTNDLPSVVSNWPTPGANEDRADNYTIETSQRHLEEGRQVHLAQVVKMNWPTPKAGNPGSRKPGTGGKVLNEEAKKWPTPMQRDYKGFDGPGKKNALKPPELYHSILQDQETETDGHTCSPSCRRLNPLFAEHLMGLPLGWTCVSEPLATESFQRWQLALSAYLARS
tara:strand:+ start:555 stop:1187 length:633 start_codon:yes stop_codon:yes gene_type:complete